MKTVSSDDLIDYRERILARQPNTIALNKQRNKAQTSARRHQRKEIALLAVFSCREFSNQRWSTITD